MPLTAEQREDIVAFLQDEADAAGELIGLEFILDRHDQITNLPGMARKAMRRELKLLRAQRPEIKADLDATVARIAVLDGILNP
jgi:hypothetical protein